ncbi:MAG: choice-of-anchor L domain-containing protein [Flavobacterium sp.]
MKKISLLLIFLYSISGYCQFPEGFEGSASNLPTNWNQYQNNIGLGKTWEISTQLSSACDGLNSAFIDKDISIQNGEESADYLITPLFTVPIRGQLRFFSRQEKAGDQETTYKVMISAFPDKSRLDKYLTIKDWDEIQMNTVYNVCQEQIVDLSAYQGQQIYLAFVRTCTKTSTNGSGDAWWIDKINVVSKCLDPSAGIISSVSATSAKLSWTDTSGSLWDIEHIVKGSSPSGSPTYTAVSKPYNLENLQPDTSYQYYVRSSCPASNSNWIGPFDFKTLPFGSVCDAPLKITSLPFQTTSNTANFPGTFNGPQSPSSSCGATPSSTNYFAGNDVFYSYTATKTGLISIKMTPTASNSSLFVYDTCPVSGACLAGAANNNSTQRVINDFLGTEGKTYTIVISSSSVNPQIGYTLVVQEENCLAPVGSLPAQTDITTTTAKLSWTNPTGASEWRIAVQPLGSAVPTIEGTKIITNPNTVVTGLSSSTQYQYYVRSVCPNGEFSSWAGPYPFTTLICEDEPTNKCTYTFRMTDLGSNGWNGATMQIRQNGIVVKTIGSDFTTGASFADITVPLCKDIPFDLYWNVLGTKPAECIVAVINSFSQTIFTKTAGINPVGTTIYNDVVSCDTPRCNIAPNNLNTLSVGPHAATLNWNAPATTAWDIYFVPAGSPLPTSSTIPTYAGVTTTTFPISNGLLADTSYTFYVRVVCSPSPSDWSAGYTFTTIATCPKPFNLLAPKTDITTTQAKLSWTNGVSTDTKWEILLVKAVSPTYGVPSAPTINPVLKQGDKLAIVESLSSTSNYLMTGLDPATIYYYYIRTICSPTDKSTWAGPTKFNTVTCEPANKCNYKFILTDSANNGWDGARMQIRQNGIPIEIDTNIYELGLSMTEKNVAICKDTPFDLYWSSPGIAPQEVGIKIVDPFGDPIYTKLPGDGTPLSVLFNYTGNCTAPTCLKPTSLKVQTTNPKSAVLEWSEIGGATQWEVYLVPTGTTPPANNTPKSGVAPYYITDKNPFTVEGLEPSTTYDFYVRALCSDSDISTWTLLTFKTFITTPENDECNTSIVVPVNSTTECLQTVSGKTTKGATATQPATNPICQGYADDDVWFSFTATSTIHTINLINITGTTTDLNHTLYSGNNCGTLTQLYCSNPNTSVATNLTIGNTYKVRVYTNAFGVNQSATFDICITTPPTITNDECFSAVDLTVNPDLVTTVSTAGSVAGATASLPASTCIGNADDDVWYKFVAKSNTHYVQLENVTGGSTDLNHAVYSGNCDSLSLKYCSTVSSLTGNDNTFVIGDTYYVRVWSNAAEPLNINFTIAIGTLAPPITTSITQYTKEELIQNILFGSPCVNISNITSSTGTDFSSVNGIGYFNKSYSAFPFKEGIILSTGSVRRAPGPNLTEQNEGALYWPGDPDIEEIVYNVPGSVASKSYNATKLEFDFIPITDKISFNYLFASEEYGDAQCGLSDAFAFFLTNKETNVTTNLALIPNTNIPVSVITVRNKKYKEYCSSEHANYFGQYYGPNGLDPRGAPVDFNGLTVPMKAEGTVIPGVTYHIKLVIADNQYSGKDSAVFIEGGSFDVGNVDLGADLLQSNNTAICPGNLHTIQSGLNPEAYTISWLKDDIEIPNQTGADLQISEPGTYTVKAHYNNSTCEATDSVLIEYYPEIVPETITDMFACSTSDVSTFDLTQNSTEILSPLEVSYYTSSEDAESETNVISTPTAFQNTTNPQIIYARIDNTETKCHKIVSFNLIIQNVTQIAIAFESGCTTNDFKLQALPVDGSFDPATSTFEWIADDGASFVATEKPNTIIVKSIGTYKVKITNSQGCTTEGTKQIKDITCSIQKGLSPDNDGINDNLDLTTLNINKLEIFNRSGTKVYSKENYKNEWHGQSNSGSDLPDGTYFYVIHLLDGKTETGWIYINRKQ